MQLDAVMIDGIAKMIMKATTRKLHTSGGMRVIDMPGARCLKMVTTRFTAVASAESSVNVIIWAHTSTRLPGAKAGPESGVYANQPASGAARSDRPAYSNRPPVR